MFFAVQALETSDFDDNWAYHSISFLTSKTGITRAIAGPLQAREVGNVPPQRDLSPLRGRTRWGTAAAWHRKRSRDAPLSTVRISEACCACAVSSYLGLPRIWWIKHCQRWSKLIFPCMRHYASSFSPQLKDYQNFPHENLLLYWQPVGSQVAMTNTWCLKVAGEGRAVVDVHPTNRIRAW